MQISVVGLDIAKQVFQVHAADVDGRPVAQLKLRRAQVLDYFRALPPCLVGMEACATAHHWARELSALGHAVRLMPPAYVKPYVKRNKTDAADAEAIAEAVTRPTMRFVPVKSAEQQAALMLHRVRELLVRQRTMLATAIRAHLAEFGIIAPQGIHRVEMLTKEVNDPAVPPLARDALMLLVDELASVWQRIDELEVRLVALHRADEVSRRLASIPGVGPITAMAIANTVPDPSMFRSGREFAAWLGSRQRAIQAVARIDWGGYPSAATATSGICSTSERVMQSALPTPPGEQLQIDFGERRVEIAGVATKVFFFVATLGYSRRLHVRAFGHEKQESWFAGMESTFQAFGGIAREVLLDNARALVLHHDPSSREVVLHPRLHGRWSRGREGTNATLSSRFAAVRVRPAHLDYWLSEPHAEEWLLIEQPDGEAEPTKYWLSSLPGTTPLPDLVANAKLRWRIERDYQDRRQRRHPYLLFC